MTGGSLFDRSRLLSRGGAASAGVVVALVVAAFSFSGQAVSEPGPAAGSARQPTAPCEAVSLPTLGGRGGNVVAASTNGILTGVADDSNGVPRAVVWKQGQLESLGIGLEAATPTAVNARGVVVGTAVDSSAGRPVGWAWVGGSVHRLGTGDGERAIPEAIDDSGRIVGAVEVNEEDRAAVWSDVDGPPRLLPAAPGDRDSHAFAIAPDGTIGGVSLGGGGTPVLWTADGQVRRLESLAGYGMVTGFDASSAPVGEAYLDNGESRAVKWNAQGQVSALGTLVKGGSSAATDAAGHGPVVGTAGGEAPRTRTRPQAMLWRAGRGQVLKPVSNDRFHGVSGTANAAVGPAGNPRVVGFSADPVGLRVPTEWRCSK